MQCISPLKASLNNNGNITFKAKEAIAGLIPFEIVCRKCLPCRLNLAREKAVRAMHEAKMHEDNIFLTLTYNEESLKSPKLIYEDFQDFMKALRHKAAREKTNPITMMVTGEYGEINKRPHWHALIFNYRPEDAKPKYETDLGEQVYTSQEIDNLWKKGNAEFGSLTLESAGYVARYAAKKLVHGKDDEHDYHPIHKTSSRRAIGRSWIEKYYEHTFNHGFITLPNGQTCKIPRYYTDWLKKEHPAKYLEYAFGKRKEIQLKAEKQAKKEEMEHFANTVNYKGGGQDTHKQDQKLKNAYYKQNSNNYRRT